MPSKRDVAIRLSAEGVRQTEGQLTGLGTRGQQALQRLERSTAPVSRGLIAVDRATGGLRNQMEGLSGRLGIAGDAMRALGPAGLAGAAAIAGLAAGFTAAVRAANRAIESLSAIGDTADRLGVTAEQLQELRFAAEQNNVATNTLEMAWQRFTRRLGEAQQGTGELLGTLEQYNIALTNADGTNRSAIAVYRDFADAVQGVRDPQEQLRIAFKAFDSEGAALVRLLRQGADGLDDYAARAREAGIVLDNELVQSALEAGDRINELEQRQQAALDTIGSVFIGWAEEWEKAETTVLESIAGITTAMRDLISESEGFLNRLGGGAVDADLNNLPGPLADIIRGNRERLGVDFRGEPVVLDPIEVRPGGGSPRKTLTDKERKELEKQQKAAERALEAQLRRGAAVVASVRTPYEQMVTKQQELNELLDAGAINMETFERASKQAFVQFLESTDGMDDGLGKTAEAAEDAAARMEAAWDEATRGMTRGLAEFFTTGEFDFRRFIANISAALLQAQLDRLIVQPATDILGGFGDLVGNFVGGLLGPSIGNTGPTGGSFAAELAGGVRPLHSGGVVGRDGGAPRHVSPLAFLDAPRFHQGGFAAGEVPIIAQVHERILTEAQQRNTADTIRGQADMIRNLSDMAGAQARGGAEVRIVLLDETRQAGPGGGPPVRAEQGRGPDGMQEVRLFIRREVFDLFDSGAIDGRLAAFGLRRSGIG